jgi:hypothetical protein
MLWITCQSNNHHDKNIPTADIFEPIGDVAENTVYQEGETPKGWLILTLPWLIIIMFGIVNFSIVLFLPLMQKVLSLAERICALAPLALAIGGLFLPE